MRVLTFRNRGNSRFLPRIPNGSLAPRLHQPIGYRPRMKVPRHLTYAEIEALLAKLDEAIGNSEVPPEYRWDETDDDATLAEVTERWDADLPAKPEDSTP